MDGTQTTIVHENEARPPSDSESAFLCGPSHRRGPGFPTLRTSQGRSCPTKSRETPMSASPMSFRPLLSALAIAGALTAAAPANAETLRKDLMLNGVTMTQAQCAALPQAVWVNAYG